MMLRAAAAIALAALAWPTAADTVYRCTGGYNQKPCPGGVPVQVGDDRSAAQRSDSGAVIRRDAKLADDMQAERLKQEAQAPSAYIPTGQDPKPARRDVKPRSKAAKNADPESGVFTAGVPGSAQDKKKTPARKKDKPAG